METKMRKRTILAMAVTVLLLAGCFALDDASFARQAMERLIEGHFTARPMFDWSVLKFGGFDVGKEYVQFKSEMQKANYERSFVTHFSQQYKGKGATKNAFFNWRSTKDFEAKEPGISVVVANCHDENTTFTFVIKREGFNRKIVEVLLLVKQPVAQTANEKK